MTAFDRYWGKKPSYDSVVFRIVPEAATRESLILAGQVDLIVLPPVADLPALQRNPAVKVLLAPSDRTIFISMNTSKPLLNDVRDNKLPAGIVGLPSALEYHRGGSCS